MTKYNVGDKVRVLNADEIIGGNEHWNNGDIVTVTEIDDNRTWLTRTKTEETFRHPFLNERELKYVELVSRKPRKSERISALETEVAELRAEVEVLKHAKATAVQNVTINPTINAGISTAELASNIKKAFAKISSDYVQARSLTPNEQRADVIKRAKAFVADREFFARLDCDLTVEFIVNYDKRTVVALLRNSYHDFRVLHKGIAKCDPDDVFNADIGKAIALARALGVEVPAEFLKAVQPTEVVVGQRAYIAPAFPNELISERTSFENGTTRISIAKLLDNTKILEDTDAVYE